MSKMYIVTEDGFKATFTPLIADGCYYLPQTARKLMEKLTSVTYSVLLDEARIVITPNKQKTVKAFFKSTDKTLFAELETLS
jgi:hypothetical protein